MLKFGFYPKELTLNNGPVRVETLAGFKTAVEDVTKSDTVDGNWYYAPPQQSRSFTSGKISERPYSSRVFGLPPTHSIVHSGSTDDDHLAFHLWSLSFFSGTRLSATEAGFLDATPIKCGSLVDFFANLQTLGLSVEFAEDFWGRNCKNRHPKQFAAAVHVLFLAQNPRLLQFERFLLLYQALDACFALTKSSGRPTPTRHADRVECMCDQYRIPVPSWAMSSQGKVEIAELRNDLVHEAIFADAPLGFKIHQGGTAKTNLTHEMQALVCRLLVAILTGQQPNYVSQSVSNRCTHLLEF